MKPFANPSQVLVLRGATLPTLDYPADTLIIRGNKIAEIGLHKNLKAHLPSQAVLKDLVLKDLGGATILPGLGDAHVHFAATGFLETSLDCSFIKTLSELLDFVYKATQRKNPGELP